MKKMRFSGIRVIRIGEGGGGGRSESCGRWVSPTLQSKLEYSGMKLEYLSYITMYVKCWNPFFMCFRFHL